MEVAKKEQCVALGVQKTCGGKEQGELKLETKRIKIQVPAIYTGKVYGLVSSYKEKEKWLDNGDLELVASIPSGTALFSFYDKLNSATHGSAITQEIEE